MSMINFENFATDAHSYAGSDDKRSIFMNGKYYMVKLANANEPKNSLQTSASNNAISEYIGSHIMQSLGLETQNTILGHWSDCVAVACEDFRKDGEELHEFSWYMQNVIPKAQIGRIPTYEQLYKTFNECSFLQSIRQESIEHYWNTIIGDALIGNFDRHKDNFGFLTNKTTGEIRPAPIYDCGSCLYPELAEQKLKYVLKNPDEIKKRIYEFPKIALNRNASKNKEIKFGYYELLSSGVDAECTNALLRIYPHIDMSKIFSIIDETPLVSNTRKNFYKQMLKYRKILILDKSYELAMGRSFANAAYEMQEIEF